MKTNRLNEELSLTDWLAIVVIVFALICLTLEVDKTEFKPKDNADIRKTEQSQLNRSASEIGKGN